MNIESKLTEIISHGLIAGLGSAAPGHMCIEAAVCLALGEPFSDSPSCVAKPDREFAININDCSWSSPEARAHALLPLALAQLETAGTDRTAWVKALAEGVIRKIVPMALRAAARLNPAHTSSLEDAARRCEEEGTKEAAHAANAAAYAAANAAANAASYSAYAAAATDLDLIAVAKEAIAG